MMHERRHFLKGTMELGALALWGRASAPAAARGESLVTENRHDTIRDIKVYRIKTMRMSKTHFIWVRIRTRNGLVGYGECYAVENTEQWIAKYMQSLQGRKVSDLINRFYLEVLNDYDPKLSFRPSMGWCGAISCLEIALWDILGKMANQPIHVLLGGAVRDKIPLYANHAMLRGKGPSTLDRILRAKEMGFDMFKFNPFSGPIEDEKTIRKQVEFVAEVRQAVGPDFKLAHDPHLRWSNSMKGAKLAAKALEPYDITFLEEPFNHRSVDMFVELAQSTSIPLATGEHMSHMDEVRNLVPTGAIKYLQPDAGNFGGILAARRACDFADIYGVQIATHNWVGPISTMATVQFNAVIPNLFKQEWPHLAYGEQWETEVVIPQLVVKQDCIDVPQGPGIGVEPDFDRLKQLDRIL